MLRVAYSRIALFVLGPLFFGLAGAAHAGVSAVLLFGTPTTSTLTAPAQFQVGPTQTVTLNLNQNGLSSDGASLLSLGLAGADAADFAIVPGGTCVPGTTFLFPAGAKCTVNIDYRPSRNSNETALLTASCSTAIGVTGGFVVTCNSAVGTVAALLGTLVESAVPALSPGMLTALAATLLALSSFAALRRTPTTRRRR